MIAPVAPPRRPRRSTGATLVRARRLVADALLPAGSNDPHGPPHARPVPRLGAWTAAVWMAGVVVAYLVHQFVFR
jgi:hypothetical protein